MIYLIFGIPSLFVIFVYITLQKRKSKDAKNKFNEAAAAGLVEPTSLHPIVDPKRCLGCASCITACPEGKILGLVNRKAQLVSPTNCIGHGACKEACPTNAITLVFGTETRGVEIPQLTRDFESNIPGLFIAGELGGMGLIKNAITQGQQAMHSIVKKVKQNTDSPLHVIIVGAGPSGLSAALTAEKEGLNYLLLEQDSIGGTVAHYPRGKVVMTQPATLPLVGQFQFREASKETLIEFWTSVVDKYKLNIQTGERVVEINAEKEGFTLRSSKKTYQCNAILLAMGRRGTPRTLDVPGEELEKVVYRLIDPEQYDGKKVLVVGGGDSALEAALAISERPNTEVTLSYRSAAFSRAKAKNRNRVEDAENANTLHVLLKSNVKRITRDSVTIECNDEETTHKNDAILVCAGGILPTPFLKKIGIHVEEKFGTQ